MSNSTLILGDFENRFLAQALLKKDSHAKITCADYGSGLNTEMWGNISFDSYDTVVIMPSFAEYFCYAADFELVTNICRELQSRFVGSLECVNTTSQVILIAPQISTFPFDLHIESRKQKIFRIHQEFSELLCSVCKSKKWKFINGFEIGNLIGCEFAFDFRHYIFAKSPGPLPYLERISDLIVNCMLQDRDRIKLVITDLDDTFWQGILADNGPLNVKCSALEPSSVPYFVYQNFIKRLSDSGIMVAICSKNDLDAVYGCFSTRKDFVVSEQEFVSIKAGWIPKSEMITEILDETGIRPSNTLFIDDSAFEVAEVQNRLGAGIKCVKFEPDIDYINRLFSSNFSSISGELSYEDKIRVSSIRDFNALKSSSHRTGQKYSDFLKGLNIKVSFDDVSTANIGRIVSLTNKTNQFNLNAKIFDEQSVNASLASGRILKAVSYCDKIADLGVIGVLEYCPREKMVLTFVMSCRVLGRGVEKKMLEYLINNCGGETNELTWDFVKTGKNIKLEDFLKGEGFV